MWGKIAEVKGLMLVASALELVVREKPAPPINFSGKTCGGYVLPLYIAPSPSLSTTPQYSTRQHEVPKNLGVKKMTHVARIKQVLRVHNPI